MQLPEPQDEHRWLHRIVGRWEATMECSMGPGQEPMRTRATETVRSLGGLWVIGEGEGEMPGGGISRSVITLGFDPAKGRFVGSFIASVMGNLWVYEGTRDAEGRALTLDTRGPSFGNPAVLADYQDVVTIESDDRRLLTSRIRGEDGSWTEFMRAEYRRLG